jgi:hypothetical protein
MAAKSKNSPPDEPDAPPAVARPRLPPLKALYAFEAACRLGSFAAGAEELGVTPSAISPCSTGWLRNGNHMRRFEDWLRALYQSALTLTHRRSPHPDPPHIALQRGGRKKGG